MCQFPFKLHHSCVQMLQHLQGGKSFHYVCVSPALRPFKVPEPYDLKLRPCRGHEAVYAIIVRNARGHQPAIV